MRRKTSSNTASARLSSLPAPAGSNLLSSGVHRLKVADTRDALLYVPRKTEAAGLPVVVALHGAGGNPQHGLDIWQPRADHYGFAILAPGSRNPSWDVIAGGYGPDIQALDQLLIYTCQHLRVQPEALAISGFSDGASYALSVGLANGDVFRNVIAFSPGFMLPPEHRGKPRIFISHGTDDAVLPIDRCSRRIVPALRRSGYQVDYQEFAGSHSIPESIRDHSVQWWYQNAPQ